MMKRLRDDGIPDAAMKAGGFWAKLLVSDADWKKMMKRLQEDDIPDAAMSTNGLWAKLLVSDADWKKMMKRLRDDDIPARRSDVHKWPMGKDTGQRC